MTELTSSIANEKIKVRWDEPYVSEALNRQIAAMPPGMYSQAALVDYDATTELRIWGGVFLLRDDVNGFGLMVRDVAQSIVDCSSLFPSASDQTWYVGVRAAYATSVITTGEYFFTDTPPTADQIAGRDGLVYFQVDIHNGDTGLDQATFTNLYASARPTPYPLRSTEGAVLSTDRQLGLLTNVQAYAIPTANEKQGLVGYPTAPTSSNKVLTQGLLSNTIKGVCRDVLSTITSGKFQISGFVYVGKGDVTTPSQYVSLWKDTAFTTPATMGANGSKIRITSIYKNDDSGPLVPSTHADANGYYENPIVNCTSDEGTPSGVDVIASYIKRTDLGSEPGYYSSPAGMGPFRREHVEDVFSKAFDSASGRWGFPSSDRLDDTLSSLLAAIDSMHMDDRTISGTWQLYYRNRQDTDDANLPNTTLSIYVASGAVLILSGPAYASGQYIYTSAVGGTVRLFYQGTNAVFMMQSTSAPASTNLGAVSPGYYNIDDNGYWDGIYSRSTTDDWNIIGKGIEMEGDASALVKRDRYSPFLRISNQPYGTSVYYGHSAAMTNGSNTLYMANALFDPVADTFERCRNDRTIDDSSALLLRPATGSNNPNVVGGFVHRGTDGDDWVESDWESMGGFVRPATNVHATSGGGCFATTGRAESLANDGTAELGYLENGILIATDESNDECGVFVVSGGALVATIYTSAYFTNTMDNAGTLNLYGTTLQNKAGVSKTVTWGVFMAKFLTTTGTFS